MVHRLFLWVVGSILLCYGLLVITTHIFAVYLAFSKGTLNYRNHNYNYFYEGYFKLKVGCFSCTSIWQTALFCWSQCMNPAAIFICYCMSWAYHNDYDCILAYHSSYKNLIVCSRQGVELRRQCIYNLAMYNYRLGLSWISSLLFGNSN